VLGQAIALPLRAKDLASFTTLDERIGPS
jgi:hypothetical protein